MKRGFARIVPLRETRPPSAGIGSMLPQGLPVLVMVLCACGSSPRPRSVPPYPESLTGEAQTTYVSYITAVQAGREPVDDFTIPPRYWTEAVRALHPLRVYVHETNVAVVQKMVGDVEHGIYISVPVSSYLPRSGDDGFEFTPDPRTARRVTGIYEFRRTKTR